MMIVSNIYIIKHDLRRIYLSTLILLGLSVIMTLLFQITTSGICHSKALLIFVSGTIFWSVAGIKVFNLSKTNKLSLFKISLLGVLMIGSNQIFVKYFVELLMYISFGCEKISSYWLPYFISNNLLINTLCFIGFVSAGKKDGYSRKDRKKPEIEVQSDTLMSNQFKEDILIKDGITQFWIKAQNIIYIEVDNNCITIFTEKKKIVLYQSLKIFSQNLNPFVFKRIHRSTMINKDFLYKIVNKPSGDAEAILKNNKVLKVSRNFKKNLMTSAT